MACFDICYPKSNRDTTQLNTTMRILLISTLAFVATSSFAQNYFGDTITSAGAMSGHDFGHKMHDVDSMPAKVISRVITVCQVKGCWMTMDLGHGETMRIVFKHYGFFVPKGIGGRTVVVEGMAYRKMIPVDELRHYAEDEGKSEEEIQAITQPKMELRFVAHGVLLI